MAPQLIRQACPWCKKVFFTYQAGMLYCGDLCVAREAYYRDHPTFKVGKKEEKACFNCGLPCRNKFCTKACERLFNKKPLEQQKPTGGGKKGGLPFEVQEKIAEKRRLFDKKHAEHFVRWGGLRDRV